MVKVLWATCVPDREVSRAAVADILETARLDPQVVRDAAVRHGLVGLLVNRLGPGVAGGREAALREELRSAAVVGAARSLRMSRELLRVDSALDAAGLTPVWIKGPALAQQLWGNPCMRSFEDLDVLLPRSQLLRARDVARSLGYRELTPWETASASEWFAAEHDLPMKHTRSGTRLELHWRVGSRFPAGGVASEVLLRGATVMRLLGRDTASLDRPHALIAHVVHAAKHGWHKYDDVAVMAALVAKMSAGDVAAVFDLADQTRCRRRLRVGVLVSAPSCGSSASERLRRDAERDIIAALLARRARALLEASSALSWVTLRSRPAARELSLLWQAATLDSALMMVVYVWRRLNTASSQDWRSGEATGRGGSTRRWLGRQRRLWLRHRR